MRRPLRPAPPPRLGSSPARERPVREAPLQRAHHHPGSRDWHQMHRLVSTGIMPRTTVDIEAAAIRPFAWRSRPMQARVDLEDKEAVRAALESA